jgi:hypothetical protein
MLTLSSPHLVTLSETRHLRAIPEAVYDVGGEGGAGDGRQ